MVATVVRTRSAPPPRRLAAIKEAGAIVFGKTNVPVWTGDFQSFNDMFGTTNNPWDLPCPRGLVSQRCGGCSRLRNDEPIGTDIGGSVQVPSAFCRVFGHKPCSE